MKSISLTQGKFAIVDDGDFESLNQWKWNVHSNGYAVRRTKIYMHREILKTPKGMYTDHIDGDRLNNQRSNLRVCTHAENIQNSIIKPAGVSGIRGVSWNSAKKKWTAAIESSNKKIFLGYFQNKEDAAQVYKEAAKKYHGEFANFRTK